MNEKLTFSQKLYLSDSMDNQKLDKLKKNLQKKPFMEKVFLLTISTNPTEQLDILEAKYLSFPYYKKHPLHVVGLAGSNGEAIGLVERIAQECLSARGDADFKAFLLEEDTQNNL